MDATRGEIVDYEVKDADGNVTDTLPMLVVHVNDAEHAGKDAQGNPVANDSYGTVVGVVFNANGTTYPVTIPAEPADPEPPAVTPEQTTEDDFASLSPEDRAVFFRDEFAQMSPEQRAEIRAALDQGESPSPAAPSPTTEPTPTPNPAQTADPSIT